MTLKMEKVEEIREMERAGMTRADIQRATGLSQPTLRKYLDMDDFSPAPPAAAARGSILYPHKAKIDAILESDKQVWRKQRHSALRIYERIRDEDGYGGSYETVKLYVRSCRERQAGEREAYLQLVWPPGEVQVDFGDVDVELRGLPARMHFLVVSFPFSNVPFVQLFGGQTAECVCRGQADIFEHVGGVPTRAVYDNATGAGRRVGDAVRESDLFRRFRLRYGFTATYCNPNSGHEKGNVENRVGWARSHFFTPVPRVDDVVSFNRSLLASTEERMGTMHYRKGLTWGELFERDLAALRPLPAKPFSCVRYETAAVDKRGFVTLDGGHRYRADAPLAGGRALVGIGAHEVLVVDPATGEIVAEHERRFGSAVGEQVDPFSQVGALARKRGGWRNSVVRAAVPESVAEAVDGLAKEQFRELMVAMGRWSSSYSFGEVAEALQRTLEATGRLRAADAEMTLARMRGFGLGAAPEPGPDLAAYDEMIPRGES